MYPAAIFLTERFTYSKSCDIFRRRLEQDVANQAGYGKVRLIDFPAQCTRRKRLELKNCPRR